MFKFEITNHIRSSYALTDAIFSSKLQTKIEILKTFFVRRNIFDVK